MRGRRAIAAGSATAALVDGAPPAAAPPATPPRGRFSYGITPALARDVGRRGAAPRRGSSSSSTRRRSPTRHATSWHAGGPALSASPAMLWQRQIIGVKGGWEVMADYQRWVAGAPDEVPQRQVHEVMAEFWENHLQRARQRRRRLPHRTAYGDGLREHALGRFDDLLHDRGDAPGDAASTSTTPSRPPSTPTRTSAASCSSCTPSAAASYDEDDVQELRPDPHRLAGRRLRDLGAVVRPRRRTGAARSR